MSARPTLEFFMLERELGEHWRLDCHTLRNARYRGEWLPYVKLPTGSIRYKLNDVLAADRAGNRGFTFEGLASILGSVRDLDNRQRVAVMEAIRKWLVPVR